ncbi:hypothetical protein V9T40_005854 [Parthenolecanium corni]|uniref:Uncharacterized protein n=1 Tax=Parthenolecanium corni TaxID=536013 RepID=A0AAN9Y921_9HEMI
MSFNRERIVLNDQMNRSLSVSSQVQSKVSSSGGVKRGATTEQSTNSFCKSSSFSSESKVPKLSEPSKSYGESKTCGLSSWNNDFMIYGSAPNPKSRSSSAYWQPPFDRRSSSSESETGRDDSFPCNSPSSACWQPPFDRRSSSSESETCHDSFPNSPDSVSDLHEEPEFDSDTD